MLDIDIGTKISQYTIYDYVARKPVYFARDEDGKLFVLKLAIPWFELKDCDPIDAGQQCLQYEFLIQSRLKHPNVCPATEYLLHGGHQIIVTPRVGARDLETRVKEDNCPIEERLATLSGAAQALAYCHEKGIVHLDVKEGNIVYNGTTGVLIDFGAARILGEPHHIADRLTVSTPDIIAPEYAKNGEYSALSDTFSFSATTYRVLTGDNPFRKRKEFFVYEAPRYKQEKMQPHKGFGALVIKGLAIEPEERPPMKELADAARELTAKQSRPPSEETSELSLVSC